jgi:hypothetical protein
MLFASALCCAILQAYATAQQCVSAPKVSMASHDHPTGHKSASCFALALLSSTNNQRFGMPRCMPVISSFLRFFLSFRSEAKKSASQTVTATKKKILGFRRLQNSP